MNDFPQVIVFDAFGTLVKIGESRSPYRKLMKWLKDNGRKPGTKDANIIMSNAVDIEQLTKLFGKVIPAPLLNEINDDLQFEVALLHKDLKCKAPLIEPNLRRNLGKWST